MPIYYRKKESFQEVSLQEISKYIQACEDEEMKVLLALAWLTGARLVELLSLEKGDFSFRSTLDKELVTITIKARKGGKKGFPTFDLNADPFIKEIVNFVNTREKIFTKGKRRFQQLLNALNKKIYPENKENWITFHYLRHSRITFLARMGATPEEIKSWTGHKSSAFEEYFQPRKVERFAGKIQ